MSMKKDFSYYTDISKKRGDIGEVLLALHCTFRTGGRIVYVCMYVCRAISL